MVERISILIVNYNRLEYLKGTIESLFATTDWPYEIIIWDNASTEPGIKDYLEQLKKDPTNYVKVIYSPQNVGVWRASNELIRRASSRETLGFVKLDNDCIMKTKGWVTKWIECCQANPIVGMIGANIEGKKERSPDTEILTLKGHRLFALLEEGTGGAVYVPGRTFQQLGMYNEEYGLYGHADKDYARRVMCLGLKFAYHRDVEVRRFAVNDNDQTGGYRGHKNLYVRRNRRIYVLNRYLYQNGMRDLAIWYEKYADVVPQNVVPQWSSSEPLVQWETGRIVQSVRDQIESLNLVCIKK